jgi:DNA-binding transcriptional regulator of glucitol operon
MVVVAVVDLAHQLAELELFQRLQDQVAQYGQVFQWAHMADLVAAAKVLVERKSSLVPEEDLAGVIIWEPLWR